MIPDIIRRILVAAFFTLWSFFSFAQEHGIRFVSGVSWKQVLNEAKRENKFVFVDCYASWCGPCRMMDKQVYTNEKVGKFFNSRFICLKLQMDSSKMDDVEVISHYLDARLVKNMYRVSVYPTFLFWRPDGNVVHRGKGFYDTAGLVKLGGDAMNPERQYYTLLSKFENGDRLPDKEMMDLAWATRGFGLDSLAHVIGNEYIDSLNLRDLMTGPNLEFMYYFTRRSKDRGFALCKDSAETIAKIYPRMSVDVCHDVATRVLYSEEMKPYERANNGKPDWERIRKGLQRYGALGQDCLDHFGPSLWFTSVIKPAMEVNADWSSTVKLVKKLDLDKGEKFLVGSVIVFYEEQIERDGEKGCKNFIEACEYYVEHYPDLARAPQHNEFAYIIFQNDMDVADLRLALRWSKYALDSADANDVWKSNYLDTYSNLLYKLGRKDEAILWEEQAIKLKPEDTGLVEVLNKMEEGKPTW